MFRLFPIQWVVCGDAPALCSATPLLASLLLDAIERRQNSTPLLG